MNPTRRNLALLLPALAAVRAQAQPGDIPSKAYRFEDIPVKPSGPGGVNKTRSVLKGDLHHGFPIEVHETELPPGGAPHPPHKHVHEEMFVVLVGQVDFMVNGATTRLGPGSVGFASGGDEHGLHNGTGAMCRYIVIELGDDKVG
jgi:quercetin dioxygenase-like cupin family protein